MNAVNRLHTQRTDALHTETAKKNAAFAALDDTRRIECVGGTERHALYTLEPRIRLKTLHGIFRKSIAARLQRSESLLLGARCRGGRGYLGWRFDHRPYLCRCELRPYLWRRCRRCRPRQAAGLLFSRVFVISYG